MHAHVKEHVNAYFEHACIGSSTRAHVGLQNDCKEMF